MIDCDPAILTELERTAVQAGETAAEYIRRSSDKVLEIDYKGATDLVTEVDHNSEQIITDRIRTVYPHHQILAEESGWSALKSDYLWVIDPLDGTTNFVHGYPSYAVSIGIFFQRQPVVAVIVELPAGNTYTASVGKGAFCNGQSISVSRTTEMRKSLLVTGFGYHHGRKWEKNMGLFKHLTDITQGVRRLGAAAVDLAHVASGKADGFWEYDLHPWDTAAGLLLVTEAGGCISRFDGSAYSIFDDQILASNGLLHNILQEELERENQVNSRFGDG